MSKKIDLYPNPGLVEAIRKDGYNKFGFDVFLVAYTVAEKMTINFGDEEEEATYEFISNAIQLTDKSMNSLKEYKYLKKEMLAYKKYSNTIEYLLEYYNFLIKNNLVSNVYEVGARYNGGIIQDYIEAVNSKKPVLFNEDREMGGKSTPKLPKEISSWFPNTKIIHSYNDHPFLIYIGGPKEHPRNWIYNMILVSMEKDKGFNYSSQLMFMNWKSNPLNR